MRAILFVLAAATAGLAAGCSQTCDTHVENTATAQRVGFEAEVDACNTQSNCGPLCRDVFQINQGDISACEITKIDTSTFTVRVVVNDTARCQAGADDAYIGWGDDEGYEDDDGCDDDSCSDGSTDDGGDDGSDDGSTDDGSSDDGGDDSGDDSGDDGGDSDDAVHVKPGVGQHVLAPKLNEVPRR